MKELPVLTVSELMNKLRDCDPNAIVITSLWNGWTDTYCAVDHMFQISSEELWNDLFGTPGETDDRVWGSKAENVVYVGSMFENNETVVKDKHQNTKEELISSN